MTTQTEAPGYFTGRVHLVEPGVSARPHGAHRVTQYGTADGWVASCLVHGWRVVKRDRAERDRLVVEHAETYYATADQAETYYACDQPVITADEVPVNAGREVA